MASEIPYQVAALRSGAARAPDGLATGAGKAVRAKRAGAKRSGAGYAGRMADVVLDQVPLAVSVLDRDATLQYWNQRFADLLGLLPLLARAPPALQEALAAAPALSAQQRERVAAFCRQEIARAEGAPADTLLRLSLGRGTRLVIQVRAIGAGNWMLLIDDRRPAQGGGGPGAGGSDAWLDALTGLANRRQFNEQLDLAIAQADARTQLSLLVIDLDRFKAVNDTLGHPVGDALLALVASRLRREMREDDVLARLGGDEFAVLACHSEYAGSLAARIVDVLSRPFLVEGHIVNTGASIGIAGFPGHAATADDLMRHADLALYEAKAAGRGTWRAFLPAMAEGAAARRALETDLRRALTLGELSLEYQPMVASDGAELTGFEAKLRWDHPARGPVAAAELVALAEGMGVMEALGAWALRSACQEAARWPAPLAVGVDVSRAQLASGERLVAAVAGALRDSGLAAPRLELEIAEAALPDADRLAEVAATLARLRETGVRIALDGYGSGYAGLARLRALPFTTVKIDGGLAAEGAEGAGAIVRAVAGAGAELGLATLADGVATGAQAARARAGGCAGLQGPHVGGPVAANEIDSVLLQYGAATRRVQQR